MKLEPQAHTVAGRVTQWWNPETSTLIDKKRRGYLVIWPDGSTRQFVTLKEAYLASQGPRMSPIRVSHPVCTCDHDCRECSSTCECEWND